MSTIESDDKRIEELANSGKNFDNRLIVEYQKYFCDLPYNYFAIASALALCWTGHAKKNYEFVKRAAAFIDKYEGRDSVIARNFRYRFRFDKLRAAIVSYKNIMTQIRGDNLLPDFTECSCKHIIHLQKNLFDLYNVLLKAGKVSGIGTWLFLGPFKIMLYSNKQLWDDDEIKKIILPTGSKFNKGVIKLRNDGYGFLNEIELDWLKNEKRPFLTNHYYCSEIHKQMIKVADKGKTSVLHINSSLHVLGQNINKKSISK